jgi:tRNA(Ile)-lysidine synthase
MSRPAAVARVLERVTSTARASEMFLPGDTVLVAVSGGPDSVCLLHALYQLRRLFRIRLEVFHLDHRLRPDSAADAQYVRRLAARLRLPFHLCVAETRPERGGSIEAWARGERLRALHAVQREVDARRIAIAHTRDDQAETVLLAALSGLGLDAMSGIRPAAGPFVRPLIDVTREEVEAFCRALHLRPRRDPTNRDPRFLRNALRLKGLPALERALGRSVREPLARTAALLREDADELSRQGRAAFPDVCEQTSEGVDLVVDRLARLPKVIAARVVRLAVVQLGGAPATKDDVDAVLDLAAGRPGRRRDLSHGLKASRDKEYVCVSRPSPESRGQGGWDGRRSEAV